MPAKRKTTRATTVALHRLFEALHGTSDREAWQADDAVRVPLGAERTPGYTRRGRPRQRVYEPHVWVFRRRLRVPGTARMQDPDPLVTALWDTLPEGERRRSRLFVHCGRCPVRFTKKGAIADARRCGRLGRYAPATPAERRAAERRAEAEPEPFEPETDFERELVAIWDELSPLHRRTLRAGLRPETVRREWAYEGASSPEAFRSRQRGVERAVARALARRCFPDRDYSIKTKGRPGFDYQRFWKDHRDFTAGEMS